MLCTMHVEKYNLSSNFLGNAHEIFSLVQIIKFSSTLPSVLEGFKQGELNEIIKELVIQVVKSSLAECLIPKNQLAGTPLSVFANCSGQLDEVRYA